MISDRDGTVTLDTAVEPIKLTRIQVVDALRGSALLGILLVHLSTWFDGGPLPSSVYESNTENFINTLTRTFVVLLATGKFYTFFSFLFGLSFALMFTRSKEPDGEFFKRFTLRLTILGLIGFLHQLHWRGDILIIYAVLGFIMLLFRKAPMQIVLAAAILLALNLPAHLRTIRYELMSKPYVQTRNEKHQKVFEKTVEANYQILKQGSYADVTGLNLRELKTKPKSQIDTGRIYITLGFLLLGLYAGRKQLFQRLSEHRVTFLRITSYSGLIVLVNLSLVATASFFSVSPEHFHKAIQLSLPVLFDLGAGALTLFYIAGLTLLFQNSSWQKVVSSLASIGKMALTNYVLQSVIGTLIFYGYGFGLIGEITTATAVTITIPIFLAQILFSRWWLSKFQYGPLEWLWRSLTYLKAQPMRVMATKPT